MTRGWFESEPSLRRSRRRVENGIDEAAHVAAERLGRAAGMARDGADEAYDRGLDAYRRGNRAVTARIGDNVVPSLLLAGLVGYAVGWLLHARH